MTTIVAAVLLLAGRTSRSAPESVCATSSDLVAINEALPGYVERYPSLNLPFGIIYGKSDRLLDYRRHGEAMRLSCPALDLELVDGGHMLHVTAPDRRAALVRRVAARQQDVYRQANLSRQHEPN